MKRSSATLAREKLHLPSFGDHAAGADSQSRGYRAEFRNSEDYDLWLRVGQGLPAGKYSEPLLRYRFSVTGMTLGEMQQALYTKMR